MCTARTRAYLVQLFAGIHDALVKENEKNSHTSYVTAPWFDMYLSSRLPLPLNYNPFLAYLPDPDPTMNEQV